MTVGGPKPERVSRRALFWLALVAFGLPAVVILISSGYKPVYDSADYARLGLSIAHGNGYPRGPLGPTAFRPPGYPALLGAVFALSGDSYTAGRLATAACGAVAVVLVYLITLRLWGGRAAVFAGALAALFPPLVALDVGFFSEPLFLAFELCALFAVIRYAEDPHGWKAPLAAGALCGLAALSRDNGLLLIPVVVIAVAVAAQSWRERTLGAASVLIAAVVVVAPWTVRNALAYHRFVPVSTETGFTMIGVLNPQAAADGGEAHVPNEEDIVRVSHNEGQFDALLTARALHYGWSHPAYVVKADLLNVMRTLALWPGRYTGFYSYSALGVRWSRLWRGLTDLSVYVIYVLALLGVATMMRGRRTPTRPPPLVLWLGPVALLVASGLAAGAARYRAPADPLFLMIAGIGSATLAHVALTRTANLRRPLLARRRLDSRRRSSPL